MQSLAGRHFKDLSVSGVLQCGPWRYSNGLWQWDISETERLEPGLESQLELCKAWFQASHPGTFWSKPVYKQNKEVIIIERTTPGPSLTKEGSGPCRAHKMTNFCDSGMLK